MGLGPVAMAFVSAEAGRTGIGPFVINAQAPDEGNMHTLLHWATDDHGRSADVTRTTDRRTAECGSYPLGLDGSIYDY